MSVNVFSSEAVTSSTIASLVFAFISSADNCSLNWFLSFNGELSSRTLLNPEATSASIVSPCFLAVSTINSSKDFAFFWLNLNGASSRTVPNLFVSAAFLVSSLTKASRDTLNDVCSSVDLEARFLTSAFKPCLAAISASASNLVMVSCITSLGVFISTARPSTRVAPLSPVNSLATANSNSSLPLNSLNSNTLVKLSDNSALDSGVVAASSSLVILDSASTSDSPPSLANWSLFASAFWFNIFLILASDANIFTSCFNCCGLNSPSLPCVNASAYSLTPNSNCDNNSSLVASSFASITVFESVNLFLIAESVVSSIAFAYASLTSTNASLLILCSANLLIVDISLSRIPNSLWVLIISNLVCNWVASNSNNSLNSASFFSLALPFSSINSDFSWSERSVILLASLSKSLILFFAFNSTFLSLYSVSVIWSDSLNSSNLSLANSKSFSTWYDFLCNNLVLIASKLGDSVVVAFPNSPDLIVNAPKSESSSFFKASILESSAFASTFIDSFVYSTTCVSPPTSNSILPSWVIAASCALNASWTSLIFCLYFSLSFPNFSFNSLIFSGLLSGFLNSCWNCFSILFNSCNISILSKLNLTCFAPAFAAFASFKANSALMILSWL